MIEFILSLTDKLTAPAKASSSALGSLAQQAKTLQGAMTSLEKQATKATALGDTEKLTKIAGQYDKYGSALEDLQPKLEGAEGGLGGLSEAFEGLELPATIAVGALAAVGGAIVDLTMKGAELSLEASQLKEKLLATFSALTGGAAAGQATLDMIHSLESSLPETEAQLVSMSQKLLAAGISSDKLAGALQATAAAEALVEGGGEKVTNLLAKLNEAGQKGSKLKFSTAMLVGTGITEQELMTALGMTPKQLEMAKKQGTLTGEQLSDAITKVLQQKGAGAIEAQTLDLSTMWSKLKDNIMHMFEDVDTKPFRQGLKDLFGLFDQNSASGKAMKAVITAVFNTIFSVAAKVFPYIKKAIEYVIIAALKMYIAFKPVIAAFKQLFSSGNSSIDVLGAFKSELGGMVDMVQRAARGIMFLIHAVVAVENAWNHAKDIAKNFIDGLVNGITGGSGLVWDAIKNLGSGAMDTLKGILGIHSPSREMMKLGAHTASGFAKGVSGAADSVGSAAAGMSQAVTKGAAGGAGAGKGGGGVNVTVQSGAININGASGDAKELTEEAVALIFERIVLQQGLAPGV